MKALIPYCFIVVNGVFFPFVHMQAQYAIPSIDYELIQINTTFEENAGHLFLLNSSSREERHLIVSVNDDNNPEQTSWADILVYSLDRQDELGPFTVTEGTPANITIDDREWGFKVLDFLEGCTISTWIE